QAKYVTADSKAASRPAPWAVFNAWTMSLKTYITHIAAFRVDMATPAMSCVACARNRLSAAAAIATQINPSTIAAFSVSKACRLAYDFHSLNSSSTCHLHLYARQIVSSG